MTSCGLPAWVWRLLEDTGICLMSPVLPWTFRLSRGVLGGHRSSQIKNICFSRKMHLFGLVVLKTDYIYIYSFVFFDLPKRCVFFSRSWIAELRSLWASVPTGKHSSGIVAVLPAIRDTISGWFAWVWTDYQRFKVTKLADQSASDRIIYSEIRHCRPTQCSAEPRFAFCIRISQALHGSNDNSFTSWGFGGTRGYPAPQKNMLDRLLSMSSH